LHTYANSNVVEAVRTSLRKEVGVEGVGKQEVHVLFTKGQLPHSASSEITNPV